MTIIVSTCFIEEKIRSVFQGKCNDGSFLRSWDEFLTTILNSPWCRRAWIRQEFLRSPDAYFLAANECIHWKLAEKAIGQYASISNKFEWLASKSMATYCDGSTHQPSFDGEICLHTIDYPRSRYLRQYADRLLRFKEKQSLSSILGFPDLVENLMEMSLFEASDPRDLVYACLGISSHGYDICPIYALDWTFEDVIIQVAQNVIKHWRALEILGWAYTTRGQLSGSDMPSWVPDWHNLPDLQMFVRKILPPCTSDLFAFFPDKQCRSSRLLQVWGVALSVVGCENHQWPRDVHFIPRPLLFEGKVQDDDEVYALHGANNLYVFRPIQECFRLVGEMQGAFDIVTDMVLCDLKRMFDRKAPAMVTINIY